MGKILFSMIGFVILAGVMINVYHDEEQIIIQPPNNEGDDESVAIGNEKILIEEPPIGYPPNIRIDEKDEVVLKYEEDMTLIHEGQNAIDWLVNFLDDGVNDNLFYLQLVTQDIKYLNSSNSTFNIRKSYCRSICANGAWDGNSREVMLFNDFNVRSKTLSDLFDSQVAFTYIHETGHLILDVYADNSEKEEWVWIYSNVRADELREYAKTNSNEDFADSYALYRLGVLHSKERVEFIKKMEKKAGVVKWES